MHAKKPFLLPYLLFYWLPNRLSLSTLSFRDLYVEQRWAELVNPCEKARADKHSPAHTQRVDVPFVDLLLLPWTRWESTSWPPPFCCPRWVAWLQVSGHICTYAWEGTWGTCMSVWHQWCFLIVFFFLPDFRAPTLGLIFIRALSVKRLRQALGVVRAASAHQHTSLDLDQLWPSFSNDNRWPGWPRAACLSAVTHFYPSHWNKNQNGGVHDVWEELSPVLSSGPAQQQSSSLRLGNTYMPNWSFIISAALCCGSQWVIWPFKNRPWEGDLVPLQQNGHPIWPDISWEEGIKWGEVWPCVALQASLVVLDWMVHSRISLNLFRISLRNRPGVWGKNGRRLVPKSQNMKLPVGELLVLGCIFRQLF